MQIYAEKKCQNIRHMHKRLQNMLHLTCTIYVIPKIRKKIIYINNNFKFVKKIIENKP